MAFESKPEKKRLHRKTIRMKKTITPKRLAPTRLALKCAATLVAAMALACSTQADPNLTNGLLAYWPMDDTNSGISSPDVQNGYDLTPRSGGGSTIVTFPGHLSVVPGVRSNAVSFNGGTGATVLAYISSQNQWGTPSTQLPPSQYPSWTLSFWVRGQAANNGGGTRIMCMGNSGDSSPLWDLGTGGANSIPTTQIDQFVRQIPDANAQGTTFVNANTGSGNHRAINANWLDGSWHNITFEAQYVTNYYAPTIIGATVDPKSGTISIPLVPFLWIAWPPTNNTKSTPISSTNCKPRPTLALLLARVGRRSPPSAPRATRAPRSTSTSTR